MISVGVDVSKGKSTVCVLKPYGEIVCSPFEVLHVEKELAGLDSLLQKLDGEIRVVMEATGVYHLPILSFLQEKGYFVSVVNPYAMKKYAKDNSIRGAQTDRLDSSTIANYGIRLLQKFLKTDSHCSTQRQAPAHFSGGLRDLCAEEISMMHIGPPLASMDLYLRREKGTITDVIHDMRAGKWACISGLDQLLLYLDDVINEEPGISDAGMRRSRGPELPEMSESFARIPAKNVKKLELRVTGCKYRTIQGEVCSSEEGAREALVFKSGLELVKRIYQMICYEVTFVKT